MQHKDTPRAGAVPSRKGSPVTAGPAGATPTTPPRHTAPPAAGKVGPAPGSRTSSSSPPTGRGPMKQHERTPAAGALPTMGEHADALHPVNRRRDYDHDGD